MKGTEIKAEGMSSNVLFVTLELYSLGLLIKRHPLEKVWEPIYNLKHTLKTV